MTQSISKCCLEDGGHLVSTTICFILWCWQCHWPFILFNLVISLTNENKQHFVPARNCCEKTGCHLTLCIPGNSSMDKFYSLLYLLVIVLADVVARPSAGRVFTMFTLRPRQNGHHFADDIFKCIFLNQNVWISIEISLKFVPKGPIKNSPALDQIMARHRPGDKPLSESMLVSYWHLYASSASES